MALPLQEIDRLKRKLRKKLRQIENLEIVDRELNDEELDKVSKKNDIRVELSSLINQCEAEEGNIEEEMKRKSDDDGTSNMFADLDDHGQNRKRVCSELQPSNEEEIVFDEESDTLINIASEEEVNGETCKEDAFVLIPAFSDQPSTSYESQDNNSETSSSVETPVAAFTPDNIAPLPKSSNQPKSQPKSQESISKQTAQKQEPTNKSGKASLTKKQQCKSKRPAEPGAHWKTSEWDVLELEGHDDLILACDIDVGAGVVATASRDTTVKIWSIATGSLLHSLRGHTGAVTGVNIIKNCDNLGESMDRPDLKSCGVSVGVDCSIKVWDLERGEMVKSYYTYNGITCLQLVPNSRVSLTGTDGGKVEVYSLTTGLNLQSNRWHEEAVSSLSCRLTPAGVLVASAGRDGLVKLYSLVEDKLICNFVSENLTTASPETSIHLRSIYSVQILDNGWIYYGDDGSNIKAIDWRNGKLYKVANHTENVGFTDSLTASGDLLISSNFDIDTGLGGVNLFLSGAEGVVKYLATLSDLDTGRISHVSVGRTDQSAIALVTAGQELKLWTLKVSGAKKDCSNSVRSCVLTLSKSLVQDSGSEEEEDDEESIHDGVRTVINASGQPLRTKSGNGFCNCIIM